MTTLAQLTLNVASYLARAYRGTATGGNATTVVDAGLTEPNGYFTGGTIWMLSGLNSGKSAAVTWDVSTHTFTFSTMTLLNAAGNLYAAANLDYPRWLLIDSINRALSQIGDLPKYNTTLTTVADQEEYSIPAGIGVPYLVEIAMYTAAPYGYYPHYNWKPINGKIVFIPDSQPDTAGYNIRLTYQGAHAELTADTDVLDNLVHPERVKWHAILHALRWMMSKRGPDDPMTAPLYAEAVARAAETDIKYPIIKQQMAPIHAFWTPVSWEPR
jgi:hypothetical protein